MYSNILVDASIEIGVSVKKMRTIVHTVSGLMDGAMHMQCDINRELFFLLLLIRQQSIQHGVYPCNGYILIYIRHSPRDYTQTTLHLLRRPSMA